jgi:hypothetical protein
MKTFSLITLLTLAFSSCAIEISVTKALDAGNDPRFLLDSKEIIIKKFEELALKPDQKLQKALSDIKVGDKDCKENKSPAIRICMLVDDTNKSTTIYFISPTEMSELSLTGVTLESEEINLKAYLKNFADHVMGQAINSEEKFKAIEAAVKEYNNEWVESIDNPKNTIRMNINKSATDEEFELIWADPDTLTFKTNYFENILTLSMTEIEVIKKETIKVLENVVSHMKRSKKFVVSENQTDHQAEKILTCEKLLSEKPSPIDVLTDKLKIGSLTIKPKDTGSGSKNTGSESEDSYFETNFNYKEKVISITCKKINNSDFKIIVLSVKLGGSFQDIEQPFFESSLYDLKPVAESFFEDTADLIQKLYGTPSD